MTKPYDSSAKGLIDADPPAWLRFFGLPGESAEIADSDLTTAVAADRLMRVHNPDYLLHTEFQSKYDADMGHRVLSYNVVSGYKYRLPVESFVVLLSKAADGSAMSGRFEFGPVSIHYHVVRIWKHSPEEFLNGPLSLLPLAVIADVNNAGRPAIIRRIKERLAIAPLDQEREVWTRTRLLAGLYCDQNELARLFEGVFQMLDLRESSFYRQILEEGREEGRHEGREAGRHEGLESVASKLIEKRFSTLSAALTARLDALTAEQLNDLILAMSDFQTLDDLETWLASLS